MVSAASPGVHRAAFARFTPALKPLAPIGNDVLQARPVGEHLAPTLPAALRTPLARHPRHAVGFDCHQHRLAMQEDFVETKHAYSILTGQIEPPQTPTRLGRRRLHPVTYHGPTGHSAPGQHNG